MGAGDLDSGRLAGEPVTTRDGESLCAGTASATMLGYTRRDLEREEYVFGCFPRLEERLKQSGGTLPAASNKCWPSRVA